MPLLKRIYFYQNKPKIKSFKKKIKIFRVPQDPRHTALPLQIFGSTLDTRRV